MNVITKIAVVCIIVGSCFALVPYVGCKPALSRQRQITLQVVQEMTSGSIVNYEQKNGEVFVTLGDKFRDCHIFLVKNPGVSIEQTLEALKIKKAELEKNATEPSPVGDTKKTERH